MSIDLSTKTSIQTNLFVRLQVDYYRTTESGSFSNQILTFSDKRESYTINGESYAGLGKLLSINATRSDLRSAGSTISISISGIPDSDLKEILYSRIKGSPIVIYRAIFDPVTGDLLSDIGTNPIGKFRGYVTNVSIDEEYNNLARTGSNTIILECANVVSLLENKIAGRKTNPTSQKKFFSNDVAMDRVPNLESSYFDFGIKR